MLRFTLPDVRRGLEMECPLPAALRHMYTNKMNQKPRSPRLQFGEICDVLE